MTRKLKTAGTTLPIPQDDSEAREAIREIGDTNRQMLRLQAEMNDKIAALQQEYGETVAPLSERTRQLTDGLARFAEAHRARLTNGGRTKTVEMATGKMSWRLRPAKVTIRKPDDVIDAIRVAGLADRFLRTKVEINKEAMLEDRPAATALKGVTIGSEGEDFIVEPFETELKEAV